MSETVTMTLTEFLLARIAEDEIDWRSVYAPTNPMGTFLLAECEAKRRIVEMHAPREDGLACSTCGGYTETSDGVRGIVHHGYAIPWPCPTLRILALPYAGPPDYDPAWRP